MAWFSKTLRATGEPGEAKERENWADLFNPRAQKAFWSDIDQQSFQRGARRMVARCFRAGRRSSEKAMRRFWDRAKPCAMRSLCLKLQLSIRGKGPRTRTKRVVILSRSAYTGQQRNGSISWSGDITGDWETFRRQIPAGLSFGMSGFPYWTTDIGGFFRPADQYTSAGLPRIAHPLVSVRGVLSHLSHTRISLRDGNVEVRSRGGEGPHGNTMISVIAFSRTFTPAAWGTTNRGEIPMRALPYVYPTDLSVRDVSDQFIFGDSLLVSPVTERHATTRKVVLPAGNDWVDFWTGKTRRGGQTITADAPIDRMPIFVKEGSIVPMGPVVQSAVAKPRSA